MISQETEEVILAMRARLEENNRAIKTKSDRAKEADVENQVLRAAYQALRDEVHPKKVATYYGSAIKQYFLASTWARWKLE